MQSIDNTFIFNDISSNKKFILGGHGSNAAFSSVDLLLVTSYNKSNTNLIYISQKLQTNEGYIQNVHQNMLTYSITHQTWSKKATNNFSLMTVYTYKASYSHF